MWEIKTKEGYNEQAKEEEITVNKEANRLNVGEDIFGGCLPRGMYERVLARKLTVWSSFNIIKTLVKFLTSCRKLELTEEQIEREA